MKDCTLKKAFLCLFLKLVHSSVNELSVRGIFVKRSVLNEKSEAVPNISILIKGITSGATVDGPVEEKISDKPP